MSGSTIRQIIVGFDGSECAVHAVGWALSLGGAVGADVTIVAAWKRTVTYDAASVSATFLSDDDLAGVMQNGIEEAMGRFPDAVSAVQAAGHSVFSQVVEGDAEEVLLDASQEADLLVVGRRGHQGFGRLLGGTSRHVADHADCAVVVVPEQV